MPEERLYIKVVLPRQGAVKRKSGGGGKALPFKPVTAAFRKDLIGGVSEAADLFSQHQGPALPLKVSLEQKALAKSHWKDAIFNANTCPVIGAGKPGQIYVKATREGLQRLKRKIETASGEQEKKELSAIKSVGVVQPEDRLDADPNKILEAAPKIEHRRALKVKLFDFGQGFAAESNAVFEADLLTRSLSALRNPQYVGQRVYTVACSTVDDIRFISQLPQVRSVGAMPTFRPVRAAATNHRPIPEELFDIASNASGFPIVGIVDSGISSSIPSLEPWVYARERFVASSDSNTYHGTFVAGLVVFGHGLNSSVPEIGEYPCRVLDVHVLPNGDATFGPVDYVTEPELLQALEQCLQRHSNEVKVWNLSLSTSEPCALDRFSDFAIQLDGLQEQYGVTFVIAAGNYLDTPLLPYPREEHHLTSGRITSPADSVLGLTVGSISQITHPSTGTQRGEPSPFTRHGPGPNYIIKPDLVHFGGNVGSDFTYPLGVTSLVAGPSIADDVGTSFAAPLIARQLAYLHHRITPSPSTTLAKAILVHNARDVRTGQRVVDGEDQFIGFGTPLGIDRALECKPWMMTLVFDEVLRPGYFLEWDDFPYPDSLVKEGKFKGEIWMTLAFPPARNPNWGSEYCETHVDAHFGVFVEGKNGEEQFKGQVPVEHINKGQLFEEFQVRTLRKWAPVRTYHRKLSAGISGIRWRLYVELLCRHDVESSTVSSQPFSLVLTIADPEQRAPVYDEMSRSLRTRFQTQNLQLRPNLRVHA